MPTDVVSRVTTIIAAVDKTTPVVNAIERRFLSLGNVARGVTDRFRGITERTGLAKLPGLFSSISNRALEAGRSFVEMALPLIGLGAGGATVAGLLDLDKALDAFVDTGSRLNVVSTRVGTTVANLQDLEHAAALVKVPAEVLDTNLGRLNRTLAQVAVGKNKEATKLLGFVGIAARDAHGHVKSAADVMPKLADQMARIQNPAQRARLAVGLFGKGGQALIPMLAQGSRGLAAARADMEQLGRMTKQEAEDAHALEVSQLRLRLAFDRVQQIIGSALAPHAKRAADAVRAWVVANRVWIQTRVHYWIGEAAKSIDRWGKQLKAIHWGEWTHGLEETWRNLKSIVDHLGGANRLLAIFLGLLVVSRVAAFINALAGVYRVLKLIALAAYANPYVVLVAALVAAAIAIYVNWNKIAHSFRYYAKVIEKDTVYYFRRIEDAIVTPLDKVRKTVADDLDAIVAYFKRAWSEIADNPLVAALLPLVGMGFGTRRERREPTGPAGAAPGAPTAPAGAAGATGPTMRVPLPPPERWKGIPYALPTSSSVDVTVRFDNAPAGMRATTSSKGPGLRTSQNVGYSMPQVQRGLA
jgi:hypothetical protein